MRTFKSSAYGVIKMTNSISSCPIWGNEYLAKGYYFPSKSICDVDASPRAGGGYSLPYGIGEEIDDFTASLSPQEKARLTTWLVDQRVQGVKYPMITREVIKYIQAKQPLPVHERVDRLLRFIATQSKRVSDYISISESTYEAYIWTESTDWSEVLYFFDHLKANRWLQSYAPLDGTLNVSVTVEGYSRIAEQATNVDSSQAFIAMWFDDSMNDAFEHGIKPAIETLGYTPMRIDKKPDADKIDDEIIAEIRRSRFLVADFTHGDDGARGGVYFEAGFAQGLGIPVIYTCRNDMIDKLHFDTRQYAHIVWGTPEELHSQLLTRIGARIGEGAKAVRVGV